MELAAAALSSLLPKLGTLLTDEYKLQKGLRGEIKFLEAEMEMMQAALSKVSNLPAHQIEDIIKLWVRDLKELSYDIEDSVDTFMVGINGTPTGAELQGFKRFFKRSISLLTKANTRHHIANDIKDIKRRIQEVANRRKRYTFEDTAAQPDTERIDPRSLACFEDAAKLVAIDGPTQKIVSLLAHGKGVKKQKKNIVSIVGIGGLGKTTIATSVYEKLKGQFECQAFVSVSLNPSMKEILSSILQQVNIEYTVNAGEKSAVELIRSIREFLIDKRYLIVIDDVWDEEAWKPIDYALIDNNLDSKVIMTTRNMDVAKLSSVDGAIYELEPLSNEDSKRLLYNRIFAEEAGVHSELEDITMKILKKCGGVPLAIITIASMLARIPNKRKYEWHGIYKSMGSGLEKDKSLENMRNILFLSYCDLPCYLKPCLLYLSIFPEDYLIQRDMLLRMWVAEGFVVEKQGGNLYELGQGYFNELVNRSMIQLVNMNKNGSTIACRVHDMILDLITSLSAQENFATTSKRWKAISPDCKVRRLSLQDCKVDNNEEDSMDEQVIRSATVNNMSHVRSLIAFGDASQWIPPLPSISVLRVLCLENFSRENNYPRNIGSLHHLRYLKLGGQLETEILKQLQNLQLLKTLDLSDALIYELPSSIVQLIQLECLIIRRVKLPDGIGNLTHLQELSGLDVQNSPNTLAELGNLTELKVLRIYGLDDNDSYKMAILQSLSKLGKLCTLMLDGAVQCSLDYMPDGWRVYAHLQCFDIAVLTFSRLPQWNFFIHELTYLSIEVIAIKQGDVQLLGALPMLCFLELKVAYDVSTGEHSVICIDQPFHSLVEFRFEHYAWLVFAQGVMPKLQRLRLYLEARMREGGPDIGLENLPSLEHISVMIDCLDTQMWAVVELETKIRDVIGTHPNHPSHEISRFDENFSSDVLEQKRREYFCGNQDGRKVPINASEEQSLSTKFQSLMAGNENDSDSEASAQKR